MEDKKALMELSLRNDFMPLIECTKMENDETDNGSIKNEEGEASDGNVVLSRDGPMMISDGHSETFISSCTCGAAKKLKSGPATPECEPRNSGNGVTEKKLSRHDRIELGRMFQDAVSCRYWELAESLILLADPLTLKS